MAGEFVRERRRFLASCRKGRPFCPPTAQELGKVLTDKDLDLATDPCIPVDNKENE
jgi:hypothetical protein